MHTSRNTKHTHRSPTHTQRITDAQVAQARSVDLLTYLITHEPDSIQQVGPGRYVLKDHDSFVISNGKWNWNSRGIAGFGALDFLCKVRNIPFIDAVRMLSSDAVTVTVSPSTPQNAPEKRDTVPQKPFALPTKNGNNNRAMAYLLSRGIAKDVIQKCINMGVLYESALNACVFVGRDGTTPKFAATRSTLGDAKKDVLGSDKQFSFCIPPENEDSTRLAVFESPIDAMAHNSIINMSETDWDGHRLSLSGVTSKALTSFIERHPEIDHIYLCLDNDQPGQEASNRIIKELLGDSRFADRKITVAPPPIGKDYGETLQGIQRLKHEIAQGKRSNQNIAIGGVAV